MALPQSPQVYVKPRFSSNEMKCGNRRVGENHSTSCGAAVSSGPKASLRALGYPTLTPRDITRQRAAEQRSALSPRRGFASLGLPASTGSIAAPQFRSMVWHYPRLADSPWAGVLTAAPQLVE